MRRLLAQDTLLAGLPAPERAVAFSAFVSFTVSRQQGNRTPFRFLILTRALEPTPRSCLRVPLYSCLPSASITKNPQSSMRDWGLKECINPHMILAPKIVRTYSIKQVFWLSLLYRPSQPSHRPVAHLVVKDLPLWSGVGITAAAPLPILTGFP